MLNTLIDDINKVLLGSGDWKSSNSKRLNQNLEGVIKRGFSKAGPLKQQNLRMSSIGQPCSRKLWYSVNLPPEDAKPLEPKVKFMFMYGDLLEEVILEVAQAAGHNVEGMQDELEIEGIKGHRDAVIDGVTIDVKSASPSAFGKFKNQGLLGNDDYGYLTQLSSYVYAAQDDPLVTDKEGGAFLAINKSTGELALDYYNFKDLGILYDTPDLFKRKKEEVKLTEPPRRTFPPVPEGKSGNMKLQTPCVFCPYQKTCYPSTRIFEGTGYNMYLTHVVREPRLKEIT